MLRLTNRVNFLIPGVCCYFVLCFNIKIKLTRLLQFISLYLSAERLQRCQFAWNWFNFMFSCTLTCPIYLFLIVLFVANTVSLVAKLHLRMTESLHWSFIIAFHLCFESTGYIIFESDWNTQALFYNLRLDSVYLLVLN